MKKINILFDASVIIENHRKLRAARSGIYFVSLNLLNKMIESNIYNVSVYYNRRLKRKANSIKKVLSNINTKFVTIQDKYELKNNIAMHKQAYKNSRFLFQKLITLLKVLKNNILLLRYSLHNNNDKILKQCEIFLSPIYALPEELNNYLHIKKFIIVHDIIPLLNISSYNSPLTKNIFTSHWLYKSIASINRDTYVLCVSENTRKDLLNFLKLNVDSKKTFVTHIAGAQILKPINNISLLELTLKKYYKKHLNLKKYIVSFCSLEPRKNIIFAINCFIKFITKHNINDLYFLLCGGKWSAFNNELNKTINKYDENLRGKIIVLGYINDKDINIFYSHALFFVFLSQYEGFGMPPLEAMQAGTPVIASNNSSLPEVTGEAGLLIPFDDEDECIKAFESMYFNADLREHCIKKGFEQANKFSWDITLEKVSGIISAALDK